MFGHARMFECRLGDVELPTVMVIGLDTSRISHLDVEMSVYTVKIKIARKGKARRPDTLNLINLTTTGYWMCILPDK